MLGGVWGIAPAPWRGGGAEEHLGADDYATLFGEPFEDDEERTAISALLPAGLVKRARQRAADDKTTLTAVIETALTHYLG